MTMQLIETKTLGTAAASIEFTSIPQDGTDLVVMFSGRNNSQNRLNGGWACQLGFNGSYANFTERELRGDGSTASSFSGTAVYLVGASSDATANTFGNSTAYISNYTSSTNKSISVNGVEENNGTEAIARITAGLWSQTAAITSLVIKAIDTSLFSIGTTISLYKITKGSSGGVVVS